MRWLPPPLLALALLLLAALPGARGAPGGAGVRAQHGVVASASRPASEVGEAILRAGGNAVDAAVGVALALAVTLPAAGNLGGGGFMLIRMADGRAIAIDYREVAPAAASRGMYLDREGNLVPGATRAGYRAAGVPGTIAGLALALRKYGTLPWRRVVEPARKLATDGIPVSPTLARTLAAAAPLLSPFPESRRIFLRDGDSYEPGEIFRQPELAETLTRLEERGPREFYEGETARRIAAAMAVNGGLVTLDDLKRYRAVTRRPLRGTYRGHDILTMPPPSSGGIALLEMLNVLEGFNLGGTAAAEVDHLLIETMRRAFADRAFFPGDPVFVRVPVAGLISKSYAAQLRKSIDPLHATPSVEARHGSPPGYESTQTTHFTVVDADGNVASNTYTLNMGYGCGVTVAGFLLNNEMDDFAAKPGAPNGFGLIQGEANAIQPRKRPLSSMTPTIVLRRGKPWLALGSPGGPTIINTVLQVLLNVIDRKMDLASAVAAPRLHHQWQPDVARCEELSPGIRASLEAKGHLLAPGGIIGDVQAVMIDPVNGARVGVSDRRSPDGAAVGY